MGKGKAWKKDDVQRSPSPCPYADLTKVPTRKLLMHLRELRVVETQMAKEDTDSLIYAACGDPYGCGCGTATKTSIARYIVKVKAELATREHIPNKIEARRIRQEKARAARSR
jgi:hypothetical protein